MTLIKELGNPHSPVSNIPQIQQRTGAGTSGVEIESLVPHQVLEAKVALSPTPNADGVRQKGIVLQGKFIPVDFPEGVEVGDTVKLEVVKTGENPVLKFIGKVQSEPAPTDSAPLPDPLLNLLKQLKLSQKSLRDLVTQLKAPGATSNTSKTSTPRELPEKLKELLAKVGIPHEQILKNPEELAKVMMRFDAGRGLKEVSQARELLSSKTENAPLPKQQQLLLDLEHALEETLLVSEEVSVAPVLVKVKEANEVTPALKRLQETAKALIQLKNSNRELEVKGSNPKEPVEALLKDLTKVLDQFSKDEISSEVLIRKLEQVQRGLPMAMAQEKILQAKDKLPENPRERELLQTLKREIEDALESVQQKAQTKPEVVQAKQNAAVETLVSPSASKVVNVLAPKTASSDVAKLELALKESGMPETISQTPFRERLSQLVNVQLKVLEQSETKVKRLLVVPSNETSLDALRRTLSDVITDEPRSDGATTPEQKSFQKFTKDLSEALNRAKTENASEQEVKKILTSALATLYKEFGLNPVEARNRESVEPSSVFAALPRETQNTLKLLEQQIRTSLNQIETPVKSGAENAVSSFQENLSMLRRFLENTLSANQTDRSNKPTPNGGSQAADSAKAKVDDLLKDLSNSLEALVKEPKSEERIRALLKETLNKIDKEFKQIQNPILSIPGNVTSTSLPTFAPRPTQALEVVDVLIRAVLGKNFEVSTPAPVKAPTIDLNKLLKPGFQDQLQKAFEQGVQREVPRTELDKLLSGTALEGRLTSAISTSKQTEVILPRLRELLRVTQGLELGLKEESATQAVRDLADYSTQLLKQLDQDASRGVAANSSTIKKALETLKAKFLSQFKEAAQLNQLSALGPSTLKALEQALQSQETLSRLTPALQAAGSSTTLMIPLLLQGMLSRLEISKPFSGSSEFANEKSEEEESSNKNSRTGRGKGNGNFERAQMNLSLSGFGNVSVDLAYRSKQILLNLYFENAEVANFVRGKLAGLESVLRLCGYEEATVSTGAIAKVPQVSGQILELLESANLKIA